MSKHLKFTALLLLFLSLSCVSEKMETQDSQAMTPDHVWEYNGENTVLKDVITELKLGSNRESLERRLKRNDVLWENAEFIMIEGKKRIMVPFLSVDNENVIGFVALYRDEAGKIQFDMTVRSDVYSKAGKLPFWNATIWDGYFRASDRTILQKRNGNPGFLKKPVNKDELKSLTARWETICYDVEYQNCFTVGGCDGAGEGSACNGSSETFCNTYYRYECFNYEVPDGPQQPNPGDPNITVDPVSGGLTAIAVQSFYTPKITNITKELKCFNQSAGAKLTLYAEQSIAGSREITSQIGHTFIGITQGGVTRSIGFYPDSPMAAVMGTQVSELHDNSGSPYDVSITINISAAQLASVIYYITHYPANYKLNDFNCTDFGIRVMSLGGMTLPSTVGSYFTFSGRNPSDLGQDMRAATVPAGGSRNLTSGTAPAKSGTCP